LTTANNARQQLGVWLGPTRVGTLVRLPTIGMSHLRPRGTRPTPSVRVELRVQGRSGRTRHPTSRLTSAAPFFRISCLRATSGTISGHGDTSRATRVFPSSLPARIFRRVDVGSEASSSDPTTTAPGRSSPSKARRKNRGRSDVSPCREIVPEVALRQEIREKWWQLDVSRLWVSSRRCGLEP